MKRAEAALRPSLFPGIVGAIGGFQAQVGTSSCFVTEEPAFLVQIPGMERGCHFLASGLSGWNVARPCADSRSDSVPLKPTEEGVGCVCSPLRFQRGEGCDPAVGMCICSEVSWSIVGLECHQPSEAAL